MYRFLDGDGLSVLLYNRFYSNGFCSYGLSCSGRFSDWGWNRLFFLRVSLSPRLGLFLGCFFGGKGKFKGAIVEFDDVAGADKPVEVGCERLFKFLEVGLGFAGFEEVIKEIRPGAAGGGFDDVEDAGDVVGDAPGFGAEPNRTPVTSETAKVNARTTRDGVASTGMFRDSGKASARMVRVPR